MLFVRCLLLFCVQGSKVVFHDPKDIVVDGHGKFPPSLPPSPSLLPPSSLPLSSLSLTLPSLEHTHLYLLTRTLSLSLATKQITLSSTGEVRKKSQNERMYIFFCAIQWHVRTFVCCDLISLALILLEVVSLLVHWMGFCQQF